MGKLKLITILYYQSPINISDEYIIQEEFEDTKGVIKIRKLKKDRQHNDQKKKGQTRIYKTLHKKLKIQQHKPCTKKTCGEPRYSGRVSSSCSTSDARRVTVKNGNKK